MWKKALVYLGLVEEDEIEDEVDPLEERPPENPPTIRKISPEELSSVSRVGARPLGQVHVTAPASSNDAQEIGDKLKSSVPVIMNLQGVEDDIVRRFLTAFVAGVAYAIDGEVQKLGPKMYLVTPANVEVSAEDRQRLRRGLFNEF
ncbi:MAG TPA: cell division protein SepF [Actinomycetota bacterium]|nr:cell division protein SepF [Actinomycetota bacterium]